MKSKQFKKIICFDIDNTICTTVKNNYQTSIPNIKAIKMINFLYKNGYKIILFTSRYMGRSKENVKIAKKKASKITIKQLKDWNLKYHKIIFGKPSFDLYIDDKAIFFKKNWYNYIKKKL